ncbi:hypothetical protein [Streptomyces milbemycinicus]|uniref:Uncharacterized protein n=1 Tax=Streptomyces milbemycinicus TaxID=476552 RepID=A0ABW8M1Y7_9ACTN
MTHAFVKVERRQLGAGVRALAADDDPGAVGVAGQVDRAGQFRDLGSATQAARPGPVPSASLVG